MQCGNTADISSVTSIRFHFAMGVVYFLISSDIMILTDPRLLPRLHVSKRQGKIILCAQFLKYVLTKKI